MQEDFFSLQAALIASLVVLIFLGWARPGSRQLISAQTRPLFQP